MRTFISGASRHVTVKTVIVVFVVALISAVLATVTGAYQLIIVGHEDNLIKCMKWLVYSMFVMMVAAGFLFMTDE